MGANSEKSIKLTCFPVKNVVVYYGGVMVCILTYYYVSKVLIIRVIFDFVFVSRDLF